MNNPKVIEEIGNEETLVMICVDDNNQYGLLIDSYYLKGDEYQTILCDSLQDAREKAKSVL